MTEFKPPGPSFFRRLFVAPFALGPTARSLGGFYQQLASLLGAGLPILRAFEVLEEQTSSRRIRTRIPLMRLHLEDGGDVAGAFARFPQVFRPLDMAMLRAGERSGRLIEVVERLADTCQRRSQLAGKFIIGVIYPVIVLHLGALLLPIIECAQGAEQPYWLLALGKLAWLYGGFVAVFVIPRMMRQFSSSAYVLDSVEEYLPVYGGVMEKLAVARFGRALEGLYASGVSLTEALPVAADACGNEPLRRRICQMVPRVDQGQPLSTAMREVGGFPAAFLNMVATGEESGELSKMLKNGADYYGNEAETALNRLVVVIPIFIYLVVAAYMGYQIFRFWSGLLGRSLGPLQGRGG